MPTFNRVVRAVMSVADRVFCMGRAVMVPLNVCTKTRNCPYFFLFRAKKPISPWTINGDLKLVGLRAFQVRVLLINPASGPAEKKGCNLSHTPTHTPTHT